ncbi:MAG: DUF4299 domain-containing protein [Butyrivibrio sp.]|nr:DUF4299 domain-containing protein [Muribaculum sp.]MCM1553708.1 DUF4299 domain-containing protein [Butyrivibrio sp.]
MSIEVTIRQKGILKKPLPLDVILGESLKYGDYDGVRLEFDKLGETEFVVYNSAHIGRGFSVVWKKGEKHKVDLRLLTPSSDEEIEDFYECVNRIAAFWSNSAIEVDGTPQSLEECLAGKEHMLRWNRDIIASLGEERSLAQAPLVLPCAFWFISLSAEDLKRVSQGSEVFRDYIHEKQNIDVYYAMPHFYRDEQGIFGSYAYTENTESIFPTKAELPFWADKSIHVYRWEIALFSITEDAVIGSIDYEQFLKIIPEDKKQPYDAEHLLIASLDLALLKQMAGVG